MHHRYWLILVLASWGGWAVAADDLPVRAGLQLWLKADALVGLTNGQTVTRWPDSAVRTQAAVQADESQTAPRFVPGAAGQLPVVRFETTLSDPPTRADRLVMEGTDSRVLNAPQLMLFVAFAKNGPNRDGFGLLSQSGNETGGMCFGARNDSSLNLIYAGLGDAPYFTSFATGERREFHVVTFVVGAGDFGKLNRIYTNGVLAAEANNADWVGTVTNQLVIGHIPGLGATGGLNGDLGEILLYHGLLPDADREKVEQYLLRRWRRP